MTVLRRGKGNKSERFRAKREELRERMTNGYRRRHGSKKWFSSRDVPNSMVLDRSKPMVVIGSVSTSSLTSGRCNEKLTKTITVFDRKFILT